MRKNLFKLLSVFLLVLKITGGAAQGSNSKRYNVIIIVISALRADHLGCYGYKKNISPNIDGFADSGIIFKNAVSQANWTLPSHVSILTSQYPWKHKVTSRNLKLDNNAMTLGKSMQAAGYITAAHTGGFDVSSLYGLNYGFDSFIETENKTLGTFSDTIPEITYWLKNNHNKKFFLYLQSYDCHPPYPAADTSPYKGLLLNKKIDYLLLNNISSAPLSPEDLQYIISCYDKGLSNADYWLEKLFSAINQLGLLKNTIIILTADHGEELGDHGTFNRYGTGNLFNENIMVPLIIKHPEYPGHKIITGPPVQLIDLYPTLLDFLSIYYDKNSLDGSSLLPAISGKKPDSAHAITWSSDKYSVMDSKYKLIFSKSEFELYRYASDKNETQNLINKYPKKAAELASALFSCLKKTGTNCSVNIDISKEMMDSLRKTGYWKR